MQPIYDPLAPKKAANLSINADLLGQAKALDINLSATLELALVAALKQKRQQQWLVENRLAIEAYNRQLEGQGVFSDGLRTF